MEPILNTFVTVAADCPVEKAETPPRKAENPSVAALQFELLSARPYELTLEDLIYEIHRRREHPGKLSAAQAKQIRAALFSKSHPCMRASPLPKRYGWACITTPWDESQFTDASRRIMLDTRAGKFAASRSSPPCVPSERRANH